MTSHLAEYLCFGSVLRLSGTGPGWLALGQMQLHLKGLIKFADLASSVHGITFHNMPNIEKMFPSAGLRENCNYEKSVFLQYFMDYRKLLHKICYIILIIAMGICTIHFLTKTTTFIPKSFCNCVNSAFAD